MELRKCVEDILERNGFDYYGYYGCFDIIARRKQIILIKILGNVDSFQEEQAKNLKIISRSLNATASLIGTHTRREKLKDNVIYERFDIPAFTPNTLEHIVSNDLPIIQRNRGGYFAKVSSEKLRANRNNKDITQTELADMVGITKKSIYEHESRDMDMQYDIAVKIEKIVGNIILPTNINVEFKNIENRPHDRFEKIVSNDLSKLGFKTDFVYKTPFNIIAKETQFLLFSDADENEKHIERNIPYMEGFSKISKKPVLIITKNESAFGLPTIEERELKEITKKELKKIVKKQ